MHERRQFERHPLICEAILETHQDRRRLVGTTIDLSFGGLCMWATQALARGTEVTVTLEPIRSASPARPGRDPAETVATGFDGPAASLKLFGKVVWCTPSQGAHQLGIAFDKSNDPVTLSALDRWLAAAAPD